MKESGKYRVTHHLGRGPDKEDGQVIFSHPDEEPAQRFYQRHLPPRVGYVLTLWRPDGSLITLHQRPAARQPIKRLTDQREQARRPWWRRMLGQ